MKKIFLASLAAFILLTPVAVKADMTDNSFPFTVNDDGSIDWGNGFITTYGPNGFTTQNNDGHKIVIKDGKLECGSNVSSEDCSFFTAYNSDLLEEVLNRILPAAGEETPPPTQQGTNGQPETNVLLEGDIATVPPPSFTPPPPAPQPPANNEENFFREREITFDDIDT